MDDVTELDLVTKGPVVLLRLRVRPGAGKNEIVGVHAGVLKCRVTAAPEKGKANQAVVKLLTGSLGLPKRAVEIVGGWTSPDKVMAISGLDVLEVRSRLGAG